MKFFTNWFKKKPATPEPAVLKSPEVLEKLLSVKDESKCCGGGTCKCKSEPKSEAKPKATPKPKAEVEIKSVTKPAVKKAEPKAKPKPTKLEQVKADAERMKKPKTK